MSGEHRQRPGPRRPVFVQECDARQKRLGMGYCQVCETLIPKADGTPHRGRNLCGHECREKLDAAWRTIGDQHLRNAIYERDDMKCQQCGERGSEVDHIKALCLLTEAESKDPHWWSLANLQLLCHKCHAAKTARDIAALRQLRRPPATLPLTLPQPAPDTAPTGKGENDAT